VCAGAQRTLDGLDLRVGRKLHVRRPKERGARLAARDGEDDVVHQVLDERTRNDDTDVRVEIAVRHASVRSGAELADIFRGFDPFAQRRGLTVAHVDQGVLIKLGVHGGCQRLGPGDAHVLVRLLVVDEHVGRVQVAPRRRDLRRHHDVELADLRRAREHLHRVGVVRDLEGLCARRGNGGSGGQWEFSAQGRGGGAGLCAHQT